MYTINRSNIKTGDLLVWSNAPSGGFWLKVVRLMTVSDFGHISIAWRIGNDLFHIEAAIPRIRVVKVPSNGSFYIIPMSRIITDPENIDSISEAIGKRYSIMDAIRGYLGIQVKSNDRWQCVELSDEYYTAKGISVDNRFLTPSRYVKRLLEKTGLGLYRVNPEVKNKEE